MQLNNVLIGAVAGSTLMFLLDPAAGRRRRALMRDQITKARRRGRVRLEATTRDMSNRTGGVAAAIRRLWTSDAVNDRRLVDRVRATVGRSCSHPGAIRAEANDGHVILRGPVLATEEQSLLRAVASVPGIKGVLNELETQTSADGVSDLEGDDRVPRQRPSVRPRRWSTTTRAILGAGLVASAVWIARAGAPESAGTEYGYGENVKRLRPIDAFLAVGELT